MKYKLPVKFLKRMLEMAEDMGYEQVGVVSARTRSGIPITKVNLYGECGEDTAAKLESKLIELIREFGMSINVLRSVKCEHEEENEDNEHKQELGSAA